MEKIKLKYPWMFYIDLNIIISLFHNSTSSIWAFKQFFLNSKGKEFFMMVKTVLLEKEYLILLLGGRYFRYFLLNAWADYFSIFQIAVKTLLLVEMP